MANLTEAETYETGIYQLERSDLWDAGVAGAGVANLAIKQLANRTKWLKEKIQNTVYNAAAQTLASSANASMTGSVYTTPNDGVTRKYLILFTTFVELTYNAAESASVRFRNLTTPADVAFGTCRENFMTMSFHWYGTIGPNNQIDMQLINGSSNNISFSQTRFTIIEQK